MNFSRCFSVSYCIARDKEVLFISSWEVHIAVSYSSQSASQTHLLTFLCSIKVKYQDIMALAELEARQFPMIQSCIFPRLVSMSDDVRKASAEAERLLNTHFASCRFAYLSVSHILHPFPSLNK